MKTHCYCFTFLLVRMLAIGLPLLAQPMAFNRVNLPPGPTSWVTDLKQDRQGYLWMATARGLHRYNGYEWTSYYQNPASPDDNALESVCPTRDGQVWVGTRSLGLDCLDPETGRISHHWLANRSKPNMIENFITVLREGRDGTLWIGTHNGLYSRNPKTGRFFHYAVYNPHDPTSLSHNQVRTIYEDRQGTVWIGTGDSRVTTLEEGGLNKLDRRTGRFTQYRHDSTDPSTLINNRVRAIFEDSRGTFWVGTWGDGLHTMDRQTGRFTRYRYNPAHPERLSRPYLKNHQSEAFWGISFINEEPSGAIWIGAYAGGLNRYDPRTGLVTHYETEQGSGGGMIANNQWSAYRTRDGVLWFGAASGQLMRVVPTNETIPFFSAPSAINTFHENETGKFWLGTHAGLIDSQPENEMTQPLFRQAARQTTLLTDHVHSFLEDRQGNYWISAWNAGLYRYNARSGQFTNYHHDPSRSGSLSPGPVTFTYEDRSSTLWVMTGSGLDRMDRQTNQFTHFRHNLNDSTSISPGPNMWGLEDRAGQFWIGTYGGGLNQMNRQTGTFTHYLKNNSIAQMREDAAGTLWVVAFLGNLYRFDRQRKKFQPFLDPNSGVPLTGVKSLVEDDRQNLWVGTTAGLVRINRQRDSLNLFGPNYGFRGAESVYDASAYKSRNGTLLFGGADGYYRFQPNQLTPNRSLPIPVVLSALRITNQPAVPTPDGPLREPLMRAKMVYLAHNQNAFAFDFAALDYRHPEQIQYTFFLENYEPAWHPLSSERTANYYNIPPGEYVFWVKAGSSDGNWTKKAVTIIISPPWWRTWWAYVLFTLLAGGIVWSFIQYRSRTLRRENRMLEDKVILRTEQLQKSLDELKATQNQLIQKEKMASLGELTAGIAHEIQNPLNFVNNFSEVSTDLVSELEDEQKKTARNAQLEAELLGDLKKNLQKIAQHGGRASSIVKGMLEHSRISAGERRPANLNALCDEYLRLAYHGLRAKDKSFNATLKTDFDPALGLINMIPQDMGRVLLNLFTNAFYAVQQRQKQAPPDYQPTVWVGTRGGAEVALISVGDNGTGMSGELQQKIFQPFFTTKPTGAGTGLGLSLAYDIVSKGHGGTLTVESQEGQGTKFVLTLPA